MKKFLAGSAIASIFTTDGQLIAISNTQINDTINLSVESQEVRSGYGNALDYIYYHSTRMEGQLEDAQFNLDYIRHNLGAKEEHTASVYKSKTITLAANKDTDNAIELPQLIGDKVWVFYQDRPYTFTVTRVSGDNYTFRNSYASLFSATVCVKYLTSESASEESGLVRNLTISSNFVPNIVKIVLEAQLFASESGAADSSRIGTVLFTIPKAQLSGAQEISLSASGVASTPLSYMALKADVVGDDVCANGAGVYGYISQVLDNVDANWYEGVKALAIDTVDDVLTVSVDTAIKTYAISENSAFIADGNKITYGYQAGGAGTILWGEDAVDYVDANGYIKAAAGTPTVPAVAAGDKIYVKVMDGEETVSSIQGDAAVIAIAQ